MATGSLREVLEQSGADEELLAWVDQGWDVRALWRTCPRADWLLRLALVARIDRRSIVGAALRCVVHSVRSQTVVDNSAQQAINQVRRWVAEGPDAIAGRPGSGDDAPADRRAGGVRGSRSAARCWAAAAAATAAAAERSSQDLGVGHTTLAAAALAFACDERADDSYYERRAHAAEAVAHATLAQATLAKTGRQADAEMAAIVRRRLAEHAVAAGLEAVRCPSWLPGNPVPRQDERHLFRGTGNGRGTA